jgi:hypothetical protein
VTVITEEWWEEGIAGAAPCDGWQHLLVLSVDPLIHLRLRLMYLITALMIARRVSKLRRMAEEALSSENCGLIDAEERERREHL